MSNNPAKYEILIKQYLSSILDISVVVKHSRPASDRVTLFTNHYYFVARPRTKPPRDHGTALVRGMRFQFLSLAGFFFCFSYPAVSQEIAVL